MNIENTLLQSATIKTNQHDVKNYTLKCKIKLNLMQSQHCSSTVAVRKQYEGAVIFGK